MAHPSVGWSIAGFLFWLACGAGLGWAVRRHGARLSARWFKLEAGTPQARIAERAAPYLGVFVFLVGFDRALGAWDFSPPLTFLYKTVLSGVAIWLIVSFIRRVRGS